MSISELYESGTHKGNLSHFAALAKIAAIDGQINEEEKKLLIRFADKLNIDGNEFNMVIQNPGIYPINPSHSKEERLHRLYDLFKMIFADHEIDEPEAKLIKRYAIGLGCSLEKADILIKKSIAVFSGKIDFEDYQYLINK